MFDLTTTLFNATRAAGLLLLLSITTLAVDFDGDAKADFALFRPSSGSWYLQSDYGDGAFAAFNWGTSSDVLAPADYDGDGKTDAAVWRPSNGTWYIRKSGNNEFLSVRWGMTTIHPTGGLPDVPVPADYDGDGADDIAVWRPDTGEWFILASSSGFRGDKPIVKKWGKLGDVPVQADYDGDGRADIAVFRAMENRWYIVNSKTGNWFVREFGQGGDVLVPADYTGDGRADLAVYRTGTWYVLNSGSGVMEPFQMNLSGGSAIPAPADYDGDKATDFALYQNGTWYVAESGNGSFRSFNFGQPADFPLNAVGAKQSIAAVP